MADQTVKNISQEDLDMDEDGLGALLDQGAAEIKATYKGGKRRQYQGVLQDLNEVDPNSSRIGKIQVPKK